MDLYDSLLGFAMSVQRAMNDSGQREEVHQEDRSFYNELVHYHQREGDEIPESLVPQALPANPDLYGHRGDVSRAEVNVHAAEQELMSALGNVDEEELIRQAIRESLHESQQRGEGESVVPREETFEEATGSGLIGQQDRAYRESLYRDMRKAEKDELEKEREREKQEEEEFLQTLKETEKLSLVEMESAMSEEPSADADGVCKLVVRILDGTRLQRRFLKTTSLGEVWGWVATLRLEHEDAVPEEFDLVTTFPRKLLEDHDASLETLGLCPHATLVVEEKL